LTVSLGALFDIPNNARLEWARELIGQLDWRNGGGLPSGDSTRRFSGGNTT